MHAFFFFDTSWLESWISNVVRFRFPPSTKCMTRAETIFSSVANAYIAARPYELCCCWWNSHHITNKRRIIQTKQDNCTQNTEDDVTLLRARMRAHTQGSGCASINLFHNIVSVVSDVKINKRHRAMKLVTVKQHLIHRRIGTSVLDERRHIGRVNFVGAGYHCY